MFKVEDLFVGCTSCTWVEMYGNDVEENEGDLFSLMELRNIGKEIYCKSFDKVDNVLYCYDCEVRG